MPSHQRSFQGSPEYQTKNPPTILPSSEEEGRLSEGSTAMDTRVSVRLACQGNTRGQDFETADTDFSQFHKLGVQDGGAGRFSAWRDPCLLDPMSRGGSGGSAEKGDSIMLARREARRERISHLQRGPAYSGIRTGLGGLSVPVPGRRF